MIFHGFAKLLQHISTYYCSTYKRTSVCLLHNMPVFGRRTHFSYIRAFFFSNEIKSILNTQPEVFLLFKPNL